MLRAKAGPLATAVAAAPDHSTQDTRGDRGNPRQALRNEAARKQTALDPRSLVAAEFMILGTSLPTEGYPAGEMLMVYRLRWQIELAFKRLKSLLRMDRMPT